MVSHLSVVLAVCGLAVWVGGWDGFSSVCGISGLWFSGLGRWLGWFLICLWFSGLGMWLGWFLICLWY